METTAEHFIERLSALRSPDALGSDDFSGVGMGQIFGLAHEYIIALEMAIAADPELAAQRRRAFAAAGSSLPPGPPEAMAAYMAAEQRLGRVRADLDPTEAASLLLGALFAIAAMPTMEDADLDPERLASVVRLFVGGIQPTLLGA